MKIMERDKKRILVCMIVVMVLSFFCIVNPREVSAKVKNTINAKKQGITYTKSIHMGTYDRDLIFIRATSDYKIKNLKTDSKYLKVSEFYGTINVDACRQGTYHVTYEVKQKKKTVKLKTTVYVTNDKIPFKSITIGGKKLKKVDGGYLSSIKNTYSDDGYYEDSDLFYHSPKYKGKMKITPKPGYKIESIFISEIDYNSSIWDIERYSRGGFDDEEVENGEYVRLNYIASGVRNGYDDEVKPGSRELVRYRDEYKYKTAYTHVSICYWDKYLKSEAWMDIVICVDAVK